MATSINRGGQIVSIHPLAEVTSTGVNQIIKDLFRAGCARLGEGVSGSLSDTTLSTGERVITLGGRASVALRDDPSTPGFVTIKVTLNAGTVLLFPVVDPFKEGSKLGNFQEFLVKVTLTKTEPVLETVLPMATLVNYRKHYLVALWKQDLEAGNAVFASFELRKIDSFTTTDSPYRDLIDYRASYDPTTRLSSIPVLAFTVEPPPSGASTVASISCGIEVGVSENENPLDYLYRLGESFRSEFGWAYQYTVDYQYIGASNNFQNNSPVPIVVVRPLRAPVWVNGQLAAPQGQPVKFALRIPHPLVDPNLQPIPKGPWEGGSTDIRYDLLRVVGQDGAGPIFDWVAQYAPEATPPHLLRWPEDGVPVFILRRSASEFLEDRIGPQSLVPVDRLAARYGPRLVTELTVRGSLTIPVEE